MFIIYKHTNILSKKTYIGYTSKNIWDRWEDHKKRARNNLYEWKFDRALRKYYDPAEWTHDILVFDIQTEEEAWALNPFCFPI
jgi:hypothetical protein